MINNPSLAHQLENNPSPVRPETAPLPPSDSSSYAAWDIVDENSWQSFPASDPPGWM